MKLSPNFSRDEFTFTQHRNIDNSLPLGYETNAMATCQMLERIRSLLSHLAGRPIQIFVSSGYRSPELNTAVGGSSTSDHMYANAADWTAPDFGTPFEVCTALKTQTANLSIGQLIHEYGRWIHTSTRIPKKLMNTIITISKAGIEVGIHSV